LDLRSSMGSRAVIGRGNTRLRQGLIAGEVALTVLLLAAAGLLIRTLIHLETMPPGFNPRGVLAAQASLDNVRYQDPAAFQKLLRESLASMRNIPGVESAAAGLTLPYERALLNGVTIGGGRGAGQQVTTNEVYVTPGYFKTLQISLLAGRVFTEEDGPSAQRVAIVNQTFARKFFHAANPVGLHFENDGLHRNRDTVIIGVVADTELSSASHLTSDTAPLADQETIYVPYAQVTDARLLSLVHAWFQPSWIVRTVHPVEGLAGQMQRALASADPNLPFSGFSSMSDLRARTLAMQRVEVALLTALAALALLLSAVGICALVAHTVTERSREIGIRLALGSTLRQAMMETGKPGVAASLAGLMLGLIACAGVLRVLRSVLYGVRVYDAPTLLSVVLMLAIVTVFASAIPAWKVARINPIQVLREE
jgi:predicted permease